MARRCSTICLPIDQDDYTRLVNSPAAFRDWLDRAFGETPELFPAAFPRGYRLKDARRSTRLGIRIRRIHCTATKQAFSVRPSFALPYMTGRSAPLPPLPPKPRTRGRKPHDPGFDVRTALYYATGVDLTAVEGIDEVHALTLVSELGTDFTKWPTVKHFASWLGLCPNWKKTGGKVQSSRTRVGKNRAAGALRLAAWCLVRSHTYLGAYLRRQRSRLGAPKAITATAHKLARILYNLMRYGLAYSKQEEAAYAEQVRQRLEKNLHRRAKELGFELKRIAPPARDTEVPPPPAE